MVKIVTDRNDDILINNELMKIYIEDLTFHIFLSIPKLLNLIPSKYHYMINTLNNKFLFNKFMIDKGLKQYIPDEVPYSKNLNLMSQYLPFIVKPHIGQAAINTTVFKSMEDLNMYFKYYGSDRFLLQKYINSNKIYICHALCKNGKLIYGKVYETKKYHKYYILNGAIKNYESRELNDREFILFSKVLELSNYHGLCCIDYDYDCDCNNEIKIFEINPRVGGSLIQNKNDFLIFFKYMIENQIIFD